MSRYVGASIWRAHDAVVLEYLGSARLFRLWLVAWVAFPESKLQVKLNSSTRGCEAMSHHSWGMPRWDLSTDPRVDPTACFLLGLF